MQYYELLVTLANAYAANEVTDHRQVLVSLIHRANRRLAKDYERTCSVSESMIYLAFIALMLK